MFAISPGETFLLPETSAHTWQTTRWMRHARAIQDGKVQISERPEDIDHRYSKRSSRGRWRVWPGVTLVGDDGHRPCKPGPILSLGLNSFTIRQEANVAHVRSMRFELQCDEHNTSLHMRPCIQTFIRSFIQDLN